jgi:hypothetical protein
MHRTRWTAVALIAPAIAALGIACDRTTPTETLRPGAAHAAPTFNHSDDGDDDNDRLRAVPFVFIGRAGECGEGYPAGSRIVTSAWLGGMGLPDNGGQNSGTNPTDNPNKRDPHLGLLLSKNGPTPDCSSSGARITGVRGMEVDATFALGFDYRNGGHCGAGAPRFNVVVRNAATNTETFHFVGGCANSAQVPAEQDPLQWTQVRALTSNPGQSFPVIPPGSRIQSISIVYDEGTDTPSASATSQEPSGVGLAVIDNIYINGRLIRSGRGVAEPRGDDGDDRGDDR